VAVLNDPVALNELGAVRERQRLLLRDADERLETARRRLEAQQAQFVPREEQLQTQLSRGTARLAHLRRQVADSAGTPNRIRRRPVRDRALVEQRVIKLDSKYKLSVAELARFRTETAKFATNGDVYERQLLQLRCDLAAKRAQSEKVVRAIDKLKANLKLVKRVSDEGAATALSTRSVRRFEELHVERERHVYHAAPAAESLSFVLRPVLQSTTGAPIAADVAGWPTRGHSGVVEQPQTTSQAHEQARERQTTLQAHEQAREQQTTSQADEQARERQTKRRTQTDEGGWASGDACRFLNDRVAAELVATAQSRKRRSLQVEVESQTSARSDTEVDFVGLPFADVHIEVPKVPNLSCTSVCQPECAECIEGDRQDRKPDHACRFE